MKIFNSENMKYSLRIVKNRSLLVLAFLLLFMNSYANNNYSNLYNSSDYKTETIIHEGIERTYHIQFPENFNSENPSPMVLALHGGGGSGKSFEQHASAGTLTIAANQRGVVLVFPEGIKKRWNSGRTEIFKSEKMHDDVGFISSIIDKMINNYGIDSERIYATGISNGGFMSLRLALELSDKVAAVAPVTAQMPKINELKRPEFPISIMIVNGTADRLVPYKGGHVRPFRLGRSKGIVLSTQKTIKMFSDFNKCTGSTDFKLLPDKAPNDGTKVEIEKYSECQDKTEVVLVKVIDGGHTWPSGAQYLTPRMVGVVSKEINASEMILDFFLRHRRKQDSFSSQNNKLPQVKSGLILNQKIAIEETERNYHLYVPNKPKGKPLVILLHGNRGNFNELVGKSLVKSPQKVWLNLAEKQDFIVVVPNGTLGSKKKRGWNDCRSDAQGNPRSDDVLFISQLLERVKKQYNYDTDRVFVVGISNGGQMAMRLAMEIPEKVTAFAAIVASMPVNSNCSDSKIPVSAFYMNGTADPILPYIGGQMASNRGLVKSTEESIAYWVTRNGTSSSSIKTTLKDSNRKDNSTVEAYKYKDGINNTEVVFYKIINGGHSEPSKAIKHRKFYKSIVGNQNGDIEMAEEIWLFFKGKSK